MPDRSASDVFSVLHPTDFSEPDHGAFAHALAIALRTEGHLTILHVGPEHVDEVAWSRYPHVRETLQAWGLLDEGSTRADVSQRLHVHVRKVALRDADVASAMQKYLDRHPTNLIVLATERRTGLPRWMHPSMAEALARTASLPTLFVPHDVEGFITADSGVSTLERLLLPLDRDPDPMAAVQRAEWAARTLGAGSARVMLLHVNDAWDLPDLIPQNGTAEAWEKKLRQGNPVEQIVKAAHDLEADLIIMPTAGHHGWLDALRGSTTERVLREAPCPLLAVPA